MRGRWACSGVLGLDGMRHSADMACTVIPPFAASLANADVGIHDIDNTQWLEAPTGNGLWFVRTELFGVPQRMWKVGIFLRSLV